MKISNWGNYPVVETNLINFKNIINLREKLLDCQPLIPRGLGRCYGDSSLSKNIFSCLKFNRMIEFNSEKGDLTCETGVSLGEILDTFVSRGWFLPVTPGTKYVTLGGAIASDVHGKNHHKCGSFCDYVTSMHIMMANGSIVECSKSNNQDLFKATCGGMGLTGIILKATIRLKRIETAYIKQKIIKAGNLEEVMNLIERNNHYDYSVAWIDCLAKGENLGRSILMLGEDAKVKDLEKAEMREDPLSIKKKNNINVPFNFPCVLLNAYSVKVFNSVYYRKNKGEHESIVDYDTYFYPLDNISNWNRLYGSRGFTQYQCVFPKETARECIKKILNITSEKGIGSFLAVLKLFGKGNDNLLSFPMEGYTMTLDFPITPDLLDLLFTFDDIVSENGGRLYLAKDVRMDYDLFVKTYKNAETFRSYKSCIDQDGKFESLQSRRLKL